LQQQTQPSTTSTGRSFLFLAVVPSAILSAIALHVANGDVSFRETSKAGEGEMGYILEFSMCYNENFVHCTYLLKLTMEEISQVEE
jgi:hypothetical protein